MGDEAKGTGKSQSTSQGQSGSVTAAFEGIMTPQTREKLIAGVKKLANECGIEVDIS